MKTKQSSRSGLWTIASVIVAGCSAIVPATVQADETAPQSSKEAMLQSVNPNVVTGSNDFYRVHVEEDSGWGRGQYTATTGSRHPAGAGLNVLFGSGSPGTSFNTIRSYTSGTDYIQDDGKSSAFNTTWLDPYAVVTPIGTTGYRTTYTLPGQPSTPDRMTIVSDVNVNGDTFENSSIEVATSIINTGPTTLSVGVRYLWDYQIGRDDGPTFQALSPDASTRTREAEFQPPTFLDYRILDNDVNESPPTFSVLGSATGPDTVVPLPTTPGRLQYTCWPSSVGTAFEYTVDPDQDVATPGSGCGGSGGDSAVLYYFGHNAANAIVIPPGATNTVSASIFLLPPPPAIPTQLRATAVGTNQIDLLWNDVSNNELGFNVERASTEDGPWSEIAALGSNTVAYADTPLAADTTYYYRVRAFNAFGQTDYSNIAHATTLDFPPLGPTNLTAVAVSAYQVDLAWVDQSANEDGFTVERADASDGPWEDVGTAEVDATAFTDETVIPLTTYYYRVVGFNSGGDSPYSNVVAVNTPDGPPRAPANLMVITISPNQIELGWTDRSVNETGVEIERAPSGMGPWTLVGLTGPDAVSFIDTGLDPLTTYYYRVRAVNNLGHSPYSNAASATTTITLPPAPANLLAVPGATDQTMVLTWTDNSGVEFLFNLERSSTTPDGPFFLIASLPADSTTYTDHSLAPCSTYYYRIRAYNFIGYSDYSVVTVGDTSGCVPQQPIGPSVLAAQALSDSTIAVSWADRDNQELGFKVSRSISADGPWNLVATVGANVTLYTDSGLAAGTRYYYRVHAFNAVGRSAWAGPVNSKTAREGAPASPTGLTAVAVSSRRVDLAWTDNSSDEVLFKIYRRVVGGTWSYIGYVLADETTYSDTGVTGGNEYEYRVVAVGHEANSARSNVARVTTPN